MNFLRCISYLQEKGSLAILPSRGDGGKIELGDLSARLI